VIEEAKREELSLNLKAKERTKRALKGSEDLEAFLSAMEKEIMDRISNKENGYKPNLKSEDLKVLNKNLKLMSTVVIPKWIRLTHSSASILMTMRTGRLRTS
jgi:hypothetical protein